MSILTYFPSAKEFCIKYSSEPIESDEDFEAAPTLPDEDIITGSLAPPPAWSHVEISASPSDAETYQTLYFAIKTINQHDLTSEMSNVPWVFLPSGQPVPPPPPVTTSFFKFGE